MRGTGLLRNSIPLLKIRGIPVEVNYSWVLIFVLVSVNLATGWFPTMLPGRRLSQYILLGSAASLCMFVCVLIHELSHSLVAQFLGLHVHSIVLHVFGGVSLIKEEHYTPAREFQVTVAGPLSSFLLAAFFLVLRTLIQGRLAFAILTFLFFVNLLLALFNLLPGFPLDGGRILRSIIAWRKKDFLAATRIASRVGVAFALLLMAYGAIVIIRGDLSGLWTVLIGIFLKEAADSSDKQVILQDVLRDRTISEIMRKDPIVLSPETSVQEAIDRYFWGYRYGSFPVAANGHAIGIVCFNEVKKVETGRRAETPVKEVMHPMSDLLQATPDETVLSALDKLSNNEVGRLIVVNSDGAIAGYLSFRDVARTLWEQHVRVSLKGEK